MSIKEIAAIVLLICIAAGLLFLHIRNRRKRK